VRLIHFDIDTLRPDHLGCYGYARATSPNIDAIAAEGIRFDGVYASDTPCLPSRSALISGRFGIHNGVVSHGGTGADPFVEGATRGFQSRPAITSWTRRMRTVGIRSATISTFGERHSAHHWYAGFNEVYNLGQMGMERADEVAVVARDWIARNARADNWFLHVHMWDPHTPYRTPDAFGDPFANDPIPGWFDEETRARRWRLPGPHSAQEIIGFQPGPFANFRRQPQTASSMAEVRRMFDGYDVGVRYADEHIGRIMNALADAGALDAAAVMISSDHGETLGELGIYCDHHTSDEHGSRLPMILKWPGLDAAAGTRVDRALHYQIDVAATILELMGARVPSNWDGVSFAPAMRAGRASGREFLVLSHGAWTAQRAIRFGDHICIRTYHDGFHGLPPLMLFNLAADPHEQRDLAAAEPHTVGRALAMLEAWHADAMRRSAGGVDPLWTTLKEGGPWHIRGHLDSYLERLKATGRDEWVERIRAGHESATAAVR
jgi:choline-sulfatase